MRNKKKKAGKVLAEANFRIHGKGWNDRPVDEVVHAVLTVSGAFQYGNQTCMAFEWENGQVWSFDTRYEHVTVETFVEFAKEVLNNRTIETIAVEVI